MAPIEQGMKMDDYPKTGPVVEEKAVTADELENDFQHQPEYGAKYDPSHDKRDMYRLGKRQELKRRFKYCEFGVMTTV